MFGLAVFRRFERKGIQRGWARFPFPPSSTPLALCRLFSRQQKNADGASGGGVKTPCAAPERWEQQALKELAASVRLVVSFQILEYLRTSMMVLAVSQPAECTRHPGMHALATQRCVAGKRHSVFRAVGSTASRSASACASPHLFLC